MTECYGLGLSAVHSINFHILFDEATPQYLLICAVFSLVFPVLDVMKYLFQHTEHWINSNNAMNDNF